MKSELTTWPRGSREYAATNHSANGPAEIKNAAQQNDTHVGIYAGLIRGGTLICTDAVTGSAISGVSLLSRFGYVKTGCNSTDAAV